jgi:hypothetical protein
MARAKEQLSVTGGQPYEQDFALWLEEQVELLRSGTFDRLDLENLIDELESMGRSDVSSDLVVLLQHLLKHQFQPKRRSRSCLVTIEEHRQRLEENFEKSPSLLRYAEAHFPKAYARARRRAIVETGIAAERFPEEPPYALNQVLDPEFLPD